MKALCILLLLGFVMCAANSSDNQTAAQKSERLKLLAEIPLPNVSGRIDHLAIDQKSNRLFVAALGNDTVEVVDLSAGKTTQSMKGFQEPQGIAFISETGKLFVTNGEGGDCSVIATDALKVMEKIAFSDDADNVRYDAAARQLYVGYGNGALGMLDLTKNQRADDIKLAGHPESFQLEQKGKRIFVNVPGANHVAVVDREKRAVIAQWPIKDAGGNFPMALDEANHRLFVGCRRPARLIVFDTDTGKEVTRLDITGDADDIFYDGQRKYLYISGGEGLISLIAQTDANNYQLAGKVTTAPGARTCLFVPELNRLYVAVPQHTGKSARIQIYEPQ